MEKFDYTLRELMLARRREKPKCIHKTWADIPSGLKAVFTDIWLAAQLAVLAFLYAFFAYVFPAFFYLSIAITVCTALYVFVCERDAQSKSSWLFLFLVSFGCGYIVYFLASKRVCYGYDRKRYAQIYARSKEYLGGTRPECSQAVKNDCEYIYNSGGFVPYCNTRIKYYANSRDLFENLLYDLEQATEFIFLEFFIVADGVLLERLIHVLSRKVQEGVEVRFLYDDAGSQGVLTAATKKRLRAAGVDFKVFAKMFAPFSFGLNFRDHRKIVVIDGKKGYVGGCNIADECINQHKMHGLWKDTGVSLEGEAVNGLSLTFLRQWEFATKSTVDYGKYANRAEKFESDSVVVPYAGGPEIEEALCRGVYANVLSGARERIYMMTPYFIPDGDMIAQLIAKARSGVDVRLVLPAVPDYPFIYVVSRSNAERLMKNGVKVYYMNRYFVHSKVMLTENCVTVGSVNIDMRAFYEEFDNGVYTNDEGVMKDALADFNEIFAMNEEQVPAKHNFFYNLIAGVLRIVSPLM